MQYINKKINRRSFIKGVSAAAVGVSLAPLASCGAGGEENKLNFYNWDTYIGETTLDDFKNDSGIEVTMDLFADNSELFAKLRNGNPGYDVIVPTNDFIPRMIQADILDKLDLSQIPNMSNMDPGWLDLPFDPGNQYSIPYMWGTMGIGYRKSAVGGININTLKYIVDSDQFSGRIAWLSEATTMFDLSFKYLGFDPNKPTLEAIAEVEKLLTKQIKHVKVIAEDNGQDLLLSREIDICVEWSGDISQVMAEDNDLAYAITSDGCYRWCDNLAIPKDAPHVKNAHAFINYLLNAKVGKDIAEYIGYGTPNQAAFDLASDEYKNDTSRFPSKQILAGLYMPEYKGEEIVTAIEQAWTRILAAS